MLVVFGPTHEETLTKRLLIVQVILCSFVRRWDYASYVLYRRILIFWLLQIICSVVAFVIRYPLASYFYDVWSIYMSTDVEGEDNNIWEVNGLDF